MTWKHDALAEDLAGRERGRKRMALTNVCVIPGNMCRPDVWSALPKFPMNKASPIAFEVKVTRADFLGDVRTAKWRTYLDTAPHVVFAAPAGLVDKAEVPAGVGLIERHDQVWRWRAAPQPIGLFPPDETGWHLAVKAWWSAAGGRLTQNAYQARKRSLAAVSSEVRELYRLSEDGRFGLRKAAGRAVEAGQIVQQLWSLAEHAELLAISAERTGQLRSWRGGLEEFEQAMQAFVRAYPGCLRSLGLEEAAERAIETLQEARH